MATWKTEAEAGTFDAATSVETGTKNIIGQLQNLASGVEVGITTALSGDFKVVGINVNKIPSIQDAIDVYVTGINNALDKINEAAKPTAAVRGTAIEKALPYYVETLTKACKNYVSNLKAFKDMLRDIEKSYTKQTATMASQITKSGKGMESSIKEYKEKY